MIRRSLPAVAGLVVGVAVGLAVLLPGRVGLDGGTPFVQLAAVTPMVVVVITGSVLVGRIVVAILLNRRRGTPLDETHPRLFAAGFSAVVGAALVALTAAGFVGSRFLADDPAPDPPGGTALTVLSLNVDHGGADPDLLATLVRERQADLVVLPEAGDPYRAQMLARLPGYRGWSAAPAGDDGSSTTLLAGPRVPEPAVTTLPGALFGSIGATLPGGLRLVGVHTAAPVPGQVPDWQADLRNLVAPACAAGGPAIVLGDVNGTEDQSAFRAARGGCTDALPAVGEGTVATWPISLPRWFGMQIDHVLVRGGVVVRDAEVVEVPEVDGHGTDHRGILARLVVPG